MITTAQPTDVRHVLREDEAITAGNLEPLEKLLSGPTVAEVRREVAALEAEVDASRKASDELLLRAGAAAHVLGQHKRAVEYLSRVKGDGVASYYRGMALTALERQAEAGESFEEAGKLGYDLIECTLRRAGAIREQGRLDEAEKLLRGVANKAAGRAEYSYQVGCIWADRGDALTAVEYFERAVDMDPHHSRALFRLAVENANRGNDEEAIRLYERSLARAPQYLGALLNLGLLYEDQENYGAAAWCFRRILEADPMSERARLYLKDIEATEDMYYDEDSARYEARMRQLLDRPISDFELTARSRNALSGMGIDTLGDLTRISEQELLAGKNFGDTSLDEVREMMGSQGLMIGQNLGRPAGVERAYAFPSREELSPDQQALLSKSIAELNLSARARKAMTRLGVTTIGQLVQHTADELLAGRNFGVTSLNEVRGKLSELDLKLRND